MLGRPAPRILPRGSRRVRRSRGAMRAPRRPAPLRSPRRAREATWPSPRAASRLTPQRLAEGRLPDEGADLREGAHEVAGLFRVAEAVLEEGREGGERGEEVHPSNRIGRSRGFEGESGLRDQRLAVQANEPRGGLGHGVQVGQPRLESHLRVAPGVLGGPLGEARLRHRGPLPPPVVEGHTYTDAELPLRKEALLVRVASHQGEVREVFAECEVERGLAAKDLFARGTENGRATGEPLVQHADGLDGPRLGKTGGPGGGGP